MKRILIVLLLLITCFLGCEKHYQEESSDVITRGGALTVSITSTPKKDPPVSESLQYSRAEFQAKYMEMQRQFQQYSPPQKQIHAVSASEVVKQ